MIRNSLLGIVLLAFVMVVLGCGTSEPPRVDAPVKASSPIDEKTGKTRKTLEVSGEIK